MGTVLPQKCVQFDYCLSEVDLDRSADIYNSLPHDSDQVSIAEAHLNAIAHLFIRHKVNHIFGIHHIHKHFQIPSQTVMLGSTLGGDSKLSPGIHMRPVSTASVDKSNIHGHNYVFSADIGFRPFEFLEGPLLKNELGEHNVFLKALAEYLTEHDLITILGLKILKSSLTDYSETMVEFVLPDQATIMLRDQVDNPCHDYRVTGWRFQQGFQSGIDVIECQKCTPTRGGSHYTTGSALGSTF